MELYPHFSICPIAWCLIMHGDNRTIICFVLYMPSLYLLFQNIFYVFRVAVIVAVKSTVLYGNTELEFHIIFCIFMWTTKKTKGKLQLCRSHLMSWHIRHIHECSACRRLQRSHITIWGGSVCNGLASGKCLVSTLIRLAVIPVKIQHSLLLIPCVSYQ